MLVLQPIYAPGFITKDGQKFDFLSARINTKTNLILSMVQQKQG